MCGLAGLFGPHVDQATVRAMIAAQRHRGPDGDGYFVRAGGGVALGHVRLKIIDLSDRAAQPMATPEGDLVLIGNGEIYNYRELKRELADYPYRSGSDNELILAAYRRWGEACVDHFIGMYAFIVWDERRGLAFCARDRLGVKPLYYAAGRHRLAVASEIKGILAAGVDAAPDYGVWAQYLALGAYECGDQTFFAGVKALPPGHTITITPDGVAHTPRRYWHLDRRAREMALDEAPEEALDGLLQDATRLRTRADVPVGLTLSGGLDSSLLLALVRETTPAAGDVRTVTGIYGDPRYDETEHALGAHIFGDVARSFETLRCGDVPDLAARLTLSQEAPYGGIPTILYERVHAEARRQGLIVMLEAQGGDELFAGYDHLRPFHYRDLLAEGGWRALRAEAARAPAIAKRWLPATRNGTAALPSATHVDGTSHLRPDCLAPDVLERVDAPVFPTPFPDHLRNAQYRDLAFTKLPRVLRMNDRLSMAHGIELRQPLLDHRLVEFAFALPGSQKISGADTKHILRRVAGRKIPHANATAPKRFVVSPQSEWLAGPLAEFVADTIGSRGFRERGLFDPGAVDRRWRDFRANGAPNSFFVWQWVNTELWFRTFATPAIARPIPDAGLPQAGEGRELRGAP